MPKANRAPEPQGDKLPEMRASKISEAPLWELTCQVAERARLLNGLEIPSTQNAGSLFSVHIRGSQINISGIFPSARTSEAATISLHGVKRPPSNNPDEIPFSTVFFPSKYITGTKQALHKLIEIRVGSGISVSSRSDSGLLSSRNCFSVSPSNTVALETLIRACFSDFLNNTPIFETKK